MQASREGSERSRYVHVVSAAYSNPDAANPRRALRRYDPRAPAGPTLLRDMERACRNALQQLDGLPAGDASPITHLFGITLPDRDFSVNALHAFYDFKSRLALGHRCQVRFEVGSSDAGAVLFASALRLLQGIEGPATALVVAGQEIAPDARRNVRDFVGQVIDGRERAAGLNMIPLGDMIMDAVVHRASVTPGALPVLLRPAAVRDLLGLWTRRKLQHGGTYAPAQRSGALTGWNRAQGRWLGSHEMAAASVGACAVILSTDPAVIGRAAGERLVRVLGVGEGDARPAVTERAEPLVFFKAMRQALSALRRASGTNIDFLRASGFAVLHDAFPSIELALLSSLGFSPTDGAQRAAGWWPNPRGGLTATGHAFAASGLVQIAHALHTFTAPTPFEAAALPAQLSRIITSPRPVHCVTASVGGPLSHVVTTLLQSVPRAGADLTEAYEPAPRHRAEPGENDAFDARAAWVADLAGTYRQLLAERAGPGERLGVLEARTRLRLDSLVAALLPLPFATSGQWVVPSVVRYRGRDWPVPLALRDEVFERLTRPVRESIAPPLDGASNAPRRVFVSDEDLALRTELEGMVQRAVESLLAVVEPPDPANNAGELRDELMAALGVPVGLFATDARAPHAHQLALLAVDGVGVDELSLGSVMRLSPTGGALAVATHQLDACVGLVPPWLLAPDDVEVDGAAYASLAGRIEAALDALRSAPWSLDGVVSLRALAMEGVRCAANRPAQRPPGGLVSLIHALVLDPDEDRDALTLSLSRWRRVIGPVTDHPAGVGESASRALAATCLIDIVGASHRSLPASLGQLHVVARAMRRAESWLAGARVEHARIADAFCLTAWLPAGTALDDASVWTALLTFARDVYQHCLDHDVGARILVTAGRALPFREIDARALGAVSASGFALEAALSRCLGPSFDAFFDAPRRDGVMAVLPEEHALRLGEPAASDDAALLRGFDEIWRLQGERLRAVHHRGGGARSSGGCGSMRCADGVYVYQLRQRHGVSGLRAPVHEAVRGG
ncbi:MAG: hypothetical protein U0325_35190 [Polyangiales bacterium]